MKLNFLVRNKRGQKCATPFLAVRSYYENKENASHEYSFDEVVQAHERRCAESNIEVGEWHSAEIKPIFTLEDFQLLESQLLVPAPNTPTGRVRDVNLYGQKLVSIVLKSWTFINPEDGTPYPATEAGLVKLPFGISNPLMQEVIDTLIIGGDDEDFTLG